MVAHEVTLPVGGELERVTLKLMRHRGKRREGRVRLARHWCRLDVEQGAYARERERIDPGKKAEGEGDEGEGGKGQYAKNDGALPYKCERTWVNGLLVKRNGRINQSASYSRFSDEGGVARRQLFPELCALSTNHHAVSHDSLKLAHHRLQSARNGTLSIVKIPAITERNDE